MLAERVAWKFGASFCLLIAVALVLLSVWLAMWALGISQPFEAWSARLSAMAALSIAYLLLGFGFNSRVYPVPTLEKGLALASVIIGALAGVGAVALALV